MINHDNLGFDAIRTAKFKKKKNSEPFQVYYQGYDSNWGEYLWADGEGTVYAEDSEIVIID